LQTVKERGTKAAQAKRVRLQEKTKTRFALKRFACAALGESWKRRAATAGAALPGAWVSGIKNP